MTKDREEECLEKSYTLTWPLERATKAKVRVRVGVSHGVAASAELLIRTASLRRNLPIPLCLTCWLTLIMTMTTLTFETLSSSSQQRAKRSSTHEMFLMLNEVRFLIESECEH